MQGIDALDEQDWTFGKFGARFGGVATVVQADAENLGRHDGGEELGDIGGFTGGREFAIEKPMETFGRTVGAQCAEMSGAGGIEIADDFHTEEALVAAA